jgi:hypothetical protein
MRCCSRLDGESSTQEASGIIIGGRLTKGRTLSSGDRWNRWQTNRWSTLLFARTFNGLTHNSFHLIN